MNEMKNIAAFSIPDDIMAKLNTGEYTRHGAIIRDHDHIVAHLKDEVDLDSCTKGGVVKNIAVAAGLVVVTVAVEEGVRVLVKFIKKARRPINRFNRAVKQYMKSLQSGNLKVSTLRKFILAIDMILSSNKEHKEQIQIEEDKLSALMSVTSCYTKHLIKHYPTIFVETQVVEEPSLTGIRSNLSMQMSILEVV